MELMLICLIILLMFIQIFNTISNVYLTKLVIQLSKENRDLKYIVKHLNRKVDLSEWTLLNLLQVLRLPQSE